MPQRFLSLALAVAAVTGVAACGNDGPPPGQASGVQSLPAELVPAGLGGLEVRAEDTSVVQGTKRPFVEAVGLYSLRSSDLLQATLQVSRFTKESEVTKPAFRTAVVGQIGSTAPRVFRMGDDTVYLTTGRRQSVAVWFKERYLFVLSTREEYERPRSLLRQALEITP